VFAEPFIPLVHFKGMAVTGLAQELIKQWNEAAEHL